LEAPQAQSSKRQAIMKKGPSSKRQAERNFKTGPLNIAGEKGTENYSPGVYNGAHKDLILTPDA